MSHCIVTMLEFNVLVAMLIFVSIYIRFIKIYKKNAENHKAAEFFKHL